MGKIRCIIVDDEPLAIEILEEYAAKIELLEVLNSFDSGIEALNFLKKNSVDIVFLDIQMPDLSGLQMAELIKGDSSVVFTTAYAEYAVEGFELEAKDYLLKPISFERFYKSVQRIEKSRQTNAQPGEDNIFVKSEYKLLKIRLDEILFIEGMKDYLRIVTLHSKVMTLMSFAKLEELLPKNRFIRVHKSYMIAFDKIDSVEGGKVIVQDFALPIGETYKNNVLSRIKSIEV